MCVHMCVHAICERMRICSEQNSNCSTAIYRVWQKVAPLLALFSAVAIEMLMCCLHLISHPVCK